MTNLEKLPKHNIGGINMSNNKSKYYEYEWVGNGKVVPQLTMGEGNTPLTWSDAAGVWIKHEERNPTGCFKDRESAVVVSRAIALGYKKIVVVSSGNAALSTAAYAQKVGLDCIAYVPEKTTLAKKNLIKLFGATICEISGFYEDVYRYVVDNPIDGAWNVTSGQNPWRVEGNKSIAYEIVDQLGHAPDVVVVPAGNGGCLAGIWRGFYEMVEAKKSDKIPVMIGVQVEGAAPIQAAILKKAKWINLGSVSDSVAEGIVAAESYCSPKAVEAIKESGGKVVVVSDHEIIDSMRELIEKESIVTEPTSAAAFAGLKKIEIDKSAEVVVINTGSGMKMLDEISSLITNDKDINDKMKEHYEYTN